MKNLFKILCLSILVASAFTSCDLGSDKAADFGNEAFVTQFPFAKKIALFLKDENEVVYDYSIPVELVGGNGLALTEDITVTFEKIDFVDNPATDSDDTYTTAIEGVDFDFVNATNSLTIPAGSTFATIPIKVYSANLDDTNQPVLVLRITQVTANGVEVVSSASKSKIDVILQAQCPSELAGSYTCVTTRLSPAGGPYTFTNEIIDELAPGLYNTTTVGQYYAPGGDTGTGATAVLPAASDAGYDFSEVCGRVLVQQQNLGHVYSNLVTQTAAQYTASTVNPATGIITVEYTISFASGLRTWRSIYTPNN